MANAAPVAKKKPASFDVLALRRALGHGVPVTRPVLAKLLGMHVNSIANLEHGSVPSAKTQKKLEEIAAKAASGKLSIPTPNKAGKKLSRKAARARITDSLSDGFLKLRHAMGISREAFAKILGASAGTIYNWEKGTTEPAARFVRAIQALGKNPPSERLVSKLRRLGVSGVERYVAQREVLSRKQGHRPGRPRARATPIVGSVPVVYADVVSVVRSGENARIRFGLVVPGEKGARCVVDVVVEAAVLGGIGR